MSRAGAVSLCVAFIALVLLGIASQPDPLTVSPTSYGHTPLGWRASYELLHELGFPVTRGLDSPAVSARSPRWFVVPELRDGGPRGARPILRFVEIRGTAVVFGAADTPWSAFGVSLEAAPLAEGAVELTGDWLRRPRRLEQQVGMRAFEPRSLPEESSVHVAAGGRPFAVEVPAPGEGRLIMVASHSFLTNRDLKQPDAAALALDLVRALGVPVFDEYMHGMREDPPLWTTLGLARITLFALATLGVALALVLRGRRLPPRRLAFERGPEPGLDEFVRSLALLYARHAGRDAGDVFAAYRAGFIHRMREGIGGLGVREERLIERISAQLDRDSPERAWLRGERRPSTRAELVAAVRALEALAGDRW